MMLTEFQCDDCGAHVSGFQPIKPAWKRCATCTWINKIVLPEDEPAVRARLGVPLIAPDDRSAA